MIIANNITKAYDGKFILKNFNYRFVKGLYLVVGKSGKGKTTLLNILSLSDSKYSGKVDIDGGVFCLKDRNNLVSNLTVKEHFKLFEIVNEKKVDYIFNIKKLMNKKIKKLSLGEVQLVLLTLVLNSNEENIILDEPFSALSKENLKMACSFIETASKNRTIIIATHNDGFFKECTIINLHKVKKDKKEIEVTNYKRKRKKDFKFRYVFIYIRKTFWKKLLFLGSLISTIISFLFLNNYLDKSFNEYLSYFKVNEGVLISRKNSFDGMNENIFYEVVKKLSAYISDYNANYYNSLLYDYRISVDNYYIDNGFAFSEVKYIEDNLSDDEVVLGLNYREFCSNNGIGYCDNEFINTLLVNKLLEDFPYKIAYVFENEKTVILSEKRFFKLYENNEYIEYYFDILKENKEKIFYLINNDDLLANFEFVLIGENDTSLRYKVDLKAYKYFKDISYQNYIVCLEQGYNCLDYLKRFNSLIKIDNYNDVLNIELKVINERLKVKEIVISSKLSQKIGKGKGEKVNFYFEYDNQIVEETLCIKDIIDSENEIIYQNSEWSFNFFKDILSFNESDLRVKNILVYEGLMRGDYESDDVYNELIKEFKSLFLNMKKSIFYISLFMSITSIIILILLEIFQNKFKREYFRYLSALDVKIKKEQ